jgi:hypothetical protein
VKHGGDAISILLLIAAKHSLKGGVKGGVPKTKEKKRVRFNHLETAYATVGYSQSASAMYLHREGIHLHLPPHFPSRVSI